MSCEHKFVHRNNDNFYKSSGRYSFTYTSIDYYFCEKCLEEKNVKKEIRLGDYEIPDKLPDWAKTITKRVGGYE
jgi:hypothetical protein